MKPVPGGLSAVKGFSFSAIECGIRYNNRLDFSLIHALQPCVASGVFTTNRVVSPQVVLCRERIDNPVRAILINATNANACTGTVGYQNGKSIMQALASNLAISESAVLMASTGIIGVQLPTEKMIAAIPRLIQGLDPSKGHIVTRAIMTTDTVPKEHAVSFSTSRGEFTIAGTAKGAGMIAPNMATLLCFIITDAPIGKPDLDRLFKKTIDRTLNAISIDGDMSTNDTAVILSPESSTPLESADDLAAFEAALHEVAFRLAGMIVRDGEGATKCVTITVKNARTDDDAKRAAKSISESLLVKTAMFGNDPNWGRIACAAGYSGADLDETRLSISFGAIPLMKNGLPVDYDKKNLIDILSQKEYDIVVDLGLGTCDFAYTTCDLSYDYVKINAEYST